MADEPEKSGQEPNLELPSLLSFGRNRKKRKAESAQDEGIHDEGQDESAQDDADTTSIAPQEAATGNEAVEPGVGLAPSPDKAKRLPPVPPPMAPVEAVTQQIPATPPSDEVPPAEAPPTDEAPQVEEPPVVASPDVTQERAQVRSDHPVADPVADPATVPVEESLGWPVEEPADQSPDHAVAPRPARRVTSLALPAMNPRLASVVTGVTVGLVGVLLAYFASRGCETVRGVGSCGGIGLLALLLIVAIEVVLGAILLKAWQISDPTSTSFLGVGLSTVFVLLFLLSALESVWMLVVIPVLSGLMFLLSWWVTTALVEVPGEDAHR